MASGEAEPLQYTTTVLRVSIHCEGCKKKVRKVLLAIEGVYKVTIDAAQHKVTVTGSVAADALVRRLLKSGKHAALWPVPAPAAIQDKKQKPEEEVAAPSAGKSGKGADKKYTKPKKVAGEEAEPESSEKKPEKDKSSEKKPEEDKLSENKAETTKLMDEAKESEGPEKKEKGSPEPVAKEANAEEAGGKKGKKKNKQKDAGGDGGAAAEKPPPQQQEPKAKPQPEQAMQPVQGPDRAHGGPLPYYPPQPVMSYNMAQPSASVSYYAPTPVVSMQPMQPPPPHIPYVYSPYPPMMMPPPPPEFMYGPPGMRSSPPQESYNNMFNEENPNSCSIM